MFGLIAKLILAKPVRLFTNEFNRYLDMYD
jgi:hypothetical protein